MMRSGNAVSSHSGLISSYTLQEKRQVLLRPNARKKNLIGLRSAVGLLIYFTLVCLWCGQTGGRDQQNFSDGQITTFLRYGTMLERVSRAWSSAIIFFVIIVFCRTWAGFLVVLGSTGCRVRAAGANFRGGSAGTLPMEIYKIGLSLNTISCVTWTGIG